MTPDSQKDLEDVVREAKQIQDTLARAENYKPQSFILANANKEGIRIDIKGGSNTYLMTITDQDLISCFNLMMQGLVNENLTRLKKRYELL